jgi:GNAT superfamily N-acetyltransferase
MRLDTASRFHRSRHQRPPPPLPHRRSPVPLRQPQPGTPEPAGAVGTDVITHPAYGRHGIATQCMRGGLVHLQRSRYVSVTLTDGTGIAGFYQRFGFQVCDDVTQRWERELEPLTRETSETGRRAGGGRAPASRERCGK